MASSTPPPPRVNRDVPEGMCVHELINQQTRQWDRGKVASLFSEDTRQEILAIPLTRMEEEDRVLWKENKKQSFSVKSTYGAQSSYQPGTI